MADPKRIAIPDFALVVLVGATGSGKSTFAAKHFLPSEVVSSDACRAVVADDEADQSASADAFELLRFTAGMRLRRRRLAVIDATSVRREDRAELVKLARAHHALPVAFVFDIDPALCFERNRGRPNRDFGPHVPRNHARLLRGSLKGLAKEGFRQVHVTRSPEEADALEIVREPLWTDRRGERGPFDVVGDVHGCFEELSALLAALGYEVEPYAEGYGPIRAAHPEGRRAIFVGDLTDRGPRNVDCLRLVMGMVEQGSALCVAGNHDAKLVKWLRGRGVALNHGLDLTVAEMAAAPVDFRERALCFLDGLRSHLWLAGGELVVAHAGLKEEMHGRGSGAVRAFAMFGETTGEVDEFGLPVRADWARGYRGAAAVVHGHTPVAEAEWLNNTLCVDTGCAFGHELSALRWPEREVASVPALRRYAEPARPLTGSSSATAQQADDRLLCFDDFLGKRRVETRFEATVVIPEENGTAALEAMSRFSVDPRWLIHLPPTMAPCPTAPQGPYLERPEQALDFFAERGVTDLVAEEKHMGSRALLVVAADAGAAQARFGVEDGKAGVVYTRTGRPFFKDGALEAALVERAGRALGEAGLWRELGTDWVLLDAEAMPWSAKAKGLLDRQYRPTAIAARASAEALLAALERAGNAEDLEGLKAAALLRRSNAERMAAVIEGYCWEASSVEDYRIAPFHLLAAEGRVFADRPHDWHMTTLARLAAADPVFRPTGWWRLDASDERDRAALVERWLSHTGAGGEGFVVKPNGFFVRGERGFVQPALKVRGKDYLRLVYGPDYDAGGNLERLRQRGLGRKLSLAEREFKLGLEGLHRFVERAPLRRTHECALAVLALESEPVDPRL